MKNLFVTLFAMMLSGTACICKAQTVIQVKYSSDSTLTVAITDSLSADLIVYKTSSPDSAGSNNGVWFFCSFGTDAQKRILVVDPTASPQLNIFYTTNISAAGWINLAKQYLMN
jgi:hypothetical protein